MTLAARFGNPFSKTLLLLGVFGLPLAILGAPATAVTLQPMTVAYSGAVSGNLSTAGF